MKASLVYILIIALMPFLVLNGASNEISQQSGDNKQQIAAAIDSLDSIESLFSGADSEDESEQQIVDPTEMAREMALRSLKKGFNAWAGRRDLNDDQDGGSHRPVAPKRGFNAWAGKRSALHGDNRYVYHRIYDKRRPWGGMARF